ncbi:MAG TPA: indole-3-glycerol phosphate synthase TrpC [Longimicrobiales bacterium]
MSGILTTLRVPNIYRTVYPKAYRKASPMSVLDQILAAKIEEIERLRPRGPELRRLASGHKPARPFAAALRAGDNVALIAEFKRRSPSAGWIRQDGLVAEITKAYSEAGARAISVLTDTEFFAGTLSDLGTARDKTSVPLLRKDFIIDEVQLLEARAAGADAVLLIVRALHDARLRELIAAAHEIGLETLVEAHDEAEVEHALTAGATVIGVNNRDLSSFRVDRDLASRIAGMVPRDVVLVAESGVRSAQDVARCGDVGMDAVLVGEALMRAADLRAAVREFAAQKRHGRT